MRQQQGGPELETEEEAPESAVCEVLLPRTSSQLAFDSVADRLDSPVGEKNHERFLFRSPARSQSLCGIGGRSGYRRSYAEVAHREEFMDPRRVVLRKGEKAEFIDVMRCGEFFR
jgi:hypothetical protein